MNASVQAGGRASFPAKLGRLAARLRDPEWRQYGRLLLLGKFLGIASVFLVMFIVNIGPHLPDLLSGAAHAADEVAAAAPAPPPDPRLAVLAGDIVNPLNTVWTLLAAFLVFGMQVGFTMLEAGFCRSRETVNVLMECVVDTCLCGILFFAFGYSFMFTEGNGWIGMQYFFLQGAPATHGPSGVAFLAFWLFQFAFADTCSTITSGAMIGRTGWIGDLLYSTAVSGFIYPILGHWCWGPDGFLALMGSEKTFLPSVGTPFHDFAGSTVVHTVGGMIALAGSIVLGPRLGRKFKRDGGGAMLPHDLTIAAAGGLLLWFGWYGFNPGSTLSAMDFIGIGRVAANTTLAACAAGLTAMFTAYIPSKKWDVSFTVNGFLAGLVAITCPCYWVSPVGAILLGSVAGVIVVLGVELLEYLRIDDPIGAVPVHGFCGIWGTLSLGLFASGEFGASGPVAPDHSAPLTGLLYGGTAQVMIAQLIGSAIITAASFGSAMVVMLVLNAMGILRVSKEGELYGLDLYEHGITAYPEYQLSSLAAPVHTAPELPAQGTMRGAILFGLVVTLAAMGLGWFAGHRPGAPAPTPPAAPAPAPDGKVPPNPAVNGSQEAKAPTDPAKPTDPADPKAATADEPKDLKAEVASLTKRIDELQGKLDAGSKGGGGDLKPLQAKVDSLAAITDMVKPLPEKLDKLDGKVGDLGKQVDTLQTDVQGLKKGAGVAAVAPKPDDTPKPADDAAMNDAVDLFKAGKYKDALASFKKLTDADAKDARLWYYAAISSGLATRNWTGGDTVAFVKKGVEQEKAGSPATDKIDAALSGLTVPTGKEWIAGYRKSAK